MKSCSRAAVRAGSHHPDLDSLGGSPGRHEDHYPFFHPAMDRRLQQREMWRDRLAEATRLAEASIMADPRLKPIPYVRWRLISQAAHHVLSGLTVDPVCDLHGVHPDDTGLVVEALLIAIAAVRQGLTAPPGLQKS